MSDPLAAPARADSVSFDNDAAYADESPSTPVPQQSAADWMTGLFIGTAQATEPGDEGELVAGTVLPETRATSAYPVDHYDTPDTRRLEATIAGIPETGVDFEPSGHCTPIAPAMSLERMQKIENPALKAVYTVPTAIITGLHYTVDYPLRGVAWTHETVNNGGINEITGLNAKVAASQEAAEAAKGTPQEDAAAATARWWGRGRSFASALEFGGEVLGLSAAASYAKNRGITAFAPDSFAGRTVTRLGLGGSTLGDIAVKLGLDEAGKAQLAKSLGQEVLNEKQHFSTLGKAQQAGLTGRLTKRFWAKEGWPIAMAVGISASGIVSNAQQGLDLVDPEQKIFKGEAREWAKQGVYGAMFAGGALLLNWSPKTGYRRVVTQSGMPGVTPRTTGFAAGMALALGLMAETYYFHNQSAQQRLLPVFHPEVYDDDAPIYTAGGSYNPLNWDGELTQAHTAASRSISWGAFGPVWAALSAWQGDWASGFGNLIGKASKPMVASSRWWVRVPGKVLDYFSVTKAETALTEFEKKWVATGEGGSWLAKKMPRGVRGLAAGTLMRRRPAFILNQVITSMPAGVAIGEAMGYASGYASKEALSGTSNRSWLTVPMNAATLSYYGSTKGYATAWEGYVPNMALLNFSWEACSMQGEQVYQSAVALADEYKSETDAQEKEIKLLYLLGTYKMAQGSEKERIRGLFTGEKGLGLDPDLVIAEVERRAAENG